MVQYLQYITVSSISWQLQAPWAMAPAGCPRKRLRKRTWLGDFLVPWEKVKDRAKNGRFLVAKIGHDPHL